MFTSMEPLQLSHQKGASLQEILHSTCLPAGWARRARVLLLLAAGMSMQKVQAQIGMCPRQIQHWKYCWQ